MRSLKNIARSVQENYRDKAGHGGRPSLTQTGGLAAARISLILQPLLLLQIDVVERLRFGSKHSGFPDPIRLGLPTHHVEASQAWTTLLVERRIN